MKRFICLLIFFLVVRSVHGDFTMTLWEPTFKGIDHASGLTTPGGEDVRRMEVQALRVDLTDPDIQLFTDPLANNGAETLGLTTSAFLKTYGVQVAVNGNLFEPCCSATPGAPMFVTGLSICTGVVVSAQEGLTDSSVIMFTKDKHGSIVSDNFPPQGTNGIWNAVAGRLVILRNGVILSTPDPNVFPRTAVGLSQEGRYLILMTIDGRLPGWSDGASDYETAQWLIRFGAYDGLQLDGGGSTTMVKAACDGAPIVLNVPNNIGPGTERVIANHLGVYARPAANFMSNIVIEPFDTTVTITWQTPQPATTQLDYGQTALYGSSFSNSMMLRNHAVTLNNLNPVSTYYFRIGSSTSGNVYDYACSLRTTNFVLETPIFAVTNTWRFTTNNLDFANWKARAYSDFFWAGSGAGLLFIENNPSVNPKNTPLPYSANTNGMPAVGVSVAPTYYFRTHFSFTNDTSRGVTLNFSAYIDDAAAFYLNGIEIKRIRLDNTPVLTYYALSDNSSGPCTGNEAICADSFSVSVTNLVRGDNVLAVELHQASTQNNDAVFGTTLSYNAPNPPHPTLKALFEGTTLTLYWNGSSYTLQESSALDGPWHDVPGPVTTSAFTLSNPAGMKFYTLRQ